MALTRKFLFGSTVIAGCFALTMGGAVHAQAVSTAPQTPVSDSENQDDGTREDEAIDQAAANAPRNSDANEVEELVVTGSRLRRNEFTSTAPIQVITAEQSTLEGLVDTADILQQSTLASGSAQINNQLTGYVFEGGPGVNTVSLRGLGAQRTLVLLNGRRAGPAGTRGQVGPFDLNVIPQSQIERIEILKDGASSIYGSDAVAGVINIITKRDLDGASLNAYANQSFDGGGEQYRVDGLIGRTYDRGFFTAGFDYYKQNELTTSERDDTACTADYLFDPETGDRLDFFDPINGGYKCYNLTNNYLSVLNSAGASFGNFQYRAPGFEYPGAAGGAAQSFVLDPTLIRSGRNGYPDTFPYFNTTTPLYDRRSVVSPAERLTFNFSGGFDITSNIEAYAELLYNNRQSEQHSARQLFPQLRSGNPNARQPNGAAFGTAAADRVQPVIALPSDNSQEVDYYRGVLGFRGAIPSSVPFLRGWDYDIYGQYSKSEASYTDDIIYRDRVNALGDTRDFSGASAATQVGFLQPCFQNAPTGNTFNPGNVSGYSCSDLPGGIPWTSTRVLQGQFTDAERAFLFTQETGNTEYIHQYVEGSIAGDLFTLPAGAVGVAVGFQFRKEEIDDTPGQQSILGNRWGQTAAGRTAGTDEIKELFGETEIPLLSGLPFAESLTLSLSGRYSDYESYGESDTYKVGLNWQITPEFRLRGTKGTSFRAPSLYEQFLGNQTGFLAQGSVDACINYEDSSNANLRENCASIGIPLEFTGSGSSATIITGGGRGVLTAETSEARSVGFIWTPTFTDINVAVDYFEIEVDDEVRQFGALNIVTQCYASDEFPANAFCGLFNRDPATFQITQINNSYVNVANQINRGIDLTVRYEREVPFGDFTFDSQFTWQLEDTVVLLGDSREDFNGTTYGFDGPDFTGQVNLRFDRGDWTVFYGIDIIGKGSDTEYYEGDVFPVARYSNIPAGIASQNVYYKQFTEFQTYHDASLRWRNDDWTLQFGILNLFDERPPGQSSGQFRIGTAAIPGYDVYGRRAFVQIGKSF